MIISTWIEGGATHANEGLEYSQAHALSKIFPARCLAKLCPSSIQIWPQLHIINNQLSVLEGENLHCNPAPHERSYTHSVPFDVHTWSDHPESNTFVDRVFADHVEGQWVPKGQRSTPGRAKHYLKVLLLHLYVTWKRSPSLSVSVSMRHVDYIQGRYNALHISKHTPSLIHHINKQGLIGLRKGWKNYSSGKGYQSIIWPLAPLIDLFKVAQLPVEAVIVHRDIEVIRVRKRKTRELIDYQDNDLTDHSRESLRNFNTLIGRTPIKLGGSEPSGKSKFCFRSFSVEPRSDDPFALGGRIYGGWWQQEGGAWRDKLTINGNPVVELDYNALHPRLLYAMVGRALEHDPYQLNSFERPASKLLLLTAINAKDEKALFQAFRRQASSKAQTLADRLAEGQDLYDPDWLDTSDLEHLEAMLTNFSEGHAAFTSLSSKTNEELRKALESLKKLNEPIAHFFCRDRGIRLQRTDSDICMKVIDDMTGRGIPVLPIHDSFIVEKGHEEVLQKVMERSALEVIGFPVRVDLKHG